MANQFYKTEVLPARAGMSPTFGFEAIQFAGAPRTGGDEPTVAGAKKESA